MSSVFNINHISSSLSSLANEDIDQKDLKDITRELCRSYKMGMIPESTFHEIIEHLLAFFIERSFQNKISGKSYKFDDKLYRSNVLNKW